MNLIRTIAFFAVRRAWLVVILSLCSLTAFATETNVPAPAASFSSYQVVSDRNIFNPNRFARSGPRTYTPRQTTRRSPSFTLAGIMSYSEGETPGTYAFFDGTSSDLRKVAKADDTIANFKVAAVTFDSVTLQSDTNQTILKVGMQMRQEGAGHWALAAQSSSYGRSSADEAGGYSSRRRSNGASGGSSDVGMIPPGSGSDTNLVENASGSGPGNQPEEAPEEPATTPTETITLPAGPASDALQRLMELRAREEQQTGNR